MKQQRKYILKGLKQTCSDHIPDQNFFDSLEKLGVIKVNYSIINLSQLQSGSHDDLIAAFKNQHWRFYFNLYKKSLVQWAFKFYASDYTKRGIAKNLEDKDKEKVKEERACYFIALIEIERICEGYRQVSE